jgi:acyl-CoA thioesterase-2
VTHALDDVLACLVMRPEGEGRYAADSVEIATGRIYGGQVLAQILVGAAQAVPAKQVKSVYVQFARDGVAPDPVHIDVAVLHEGGTYATCDVRVSQDERVIADATVSLHVPGEGPEQQSAELLDHDPDGATPQVLGMIPCETRVVGGVNLREDTVGPAEFAFWMRAAELDAPLAVHQALVAYASDLSPISTALRAIPACRNSTRTGPCRRRRRVTRSGSTTTSTSPIGCACSSGHRSQARVARSGSATCSTAPAGASPHTRRTRWCGGCRPDRARWPEPRLDTRVVN